jgi:hypothetical protein
MVNETCRSSVKTFTKCKLNALYRRHRDPLTRKDPGYGIIQQKIG